MKNKVRVWKSTSAYASRPWIMKCSCMRLAGQVYEHGTWAEALDRALAHWRYWHRQEA